MSSSTIAQQPPTGSYTISERNHWSLEPVLGIQYRIDDYAVGLETGLIAFNSAKGSQSNKLGVKHTEHYKLTQKTYGVPLLAVLSIDLPYNFNLDVKGGLIYNWQGEKSQYSEIKKGKTVRSYTYANKINRSFDPMGSLTLSYKINKYFSVQAGYTSTQKFNSMSAGFKVIL